MPLARPIRAPWRGRFPEVLGFHLGALAASIEERSTIERTPTVIRDPDALNFDCQTTSRHFGLGRHRREPIADEVSKHVR
jgi:hypothetical protein